MVKVKTNEIQGATLDYAVVVAEGFTDSFAASIIIMQTYSPSTNWSHGFPIIEREEICIWKSSEPEKGKWASAGPAWMELDVDSPEFQELPDPWHGETPLIAAMRCYVASKLGDIVDIPDELV